MNAYIENMTDRQKFLARRACEVFAILAVIVGLWLASGIREVHPVIVHNDHAPVVFQEPTVST